MNKIFHFLIELIFWIAIFASPVLVSAAIAAYVYFSNARLFWLSIVFCSVGVLLGAFVAEKIRRKYGCAKYISKILGSPDVLHDEESDDSKKIF